MCVNEGVDLEFVEKGWLNFVERPISKYIALGSSG